ncbi:IS66 family insertion sequence element accessory protein TnpB [Lacticaseibacillus paracasei]|uniref:IS66 family insertion sequence element accessory protein TnpB n=1 Tax=Lacticaseibacillus paracasei TaxID=1597 RepID=UPI000FF50E9F|nr:IS66 family insertion sequence element accessory protein TnpB [Lacticaseibacillus paracasei]MCZ2766627.1 IS66 family insertion sequence element accessory protein TnpB [Lacticaseibacillus paracasei]MCZ2769564.1 IS66 family insertion sequence element accessory protein TnpB [Lacticaseibacillus paracasei]MCZ2775072.1 IS66 family insertion sequence element accessory protein TnpB [Lacticaseibacillus paracasei]MCZ2777981.1 IS66 family insertion sequence element accessory protein TnpB [Lacticaseibac
MLIDLNRITQIYLVYGKTDLRRDIDDLATIVQDQYQSNPYCQNLYLFCGTRKDRFKAPYWDGDGFILLYKRFENGRLQWPTNKKTAKTLTSTQLTRLLTGWSIESTIHPVVPPKKTLVSRERSGKV